MYVEDVLRPRNLTMRCAGHCAHSPRPRTARARVRRSSWWRDIILWLPYSIAPSLAGYYLMTSQEITFEPHGQNKYVFQHGRKCLFRPSAARSADIDRCITRPLPIERYRAIAQPNTRPWLHFSERKRDDITIIGRCKGTDLQFGNAFRQTTGSIFSAGQHFTKEPGISSIDT